MRRWHGRVLLALGLFGLSAAASGQDVDRGVVSPYFECPYVNYFDTDCPQLRERETREPVTGSRAPVEERARAAPADEAGEPEAEAGVGQGLTPEELILFPRESLAPDAPPLFRLLLSDPTLENARRYVRWHARRAARLRVVQALIRRAGEEPQAAGDPAARPVESE